MFRKTKRVFLDYASTTPTDRRVLRAMKPFFVQDFANPSALYDEGVDVREMIEAARERMARLLQVRSGEIIFTGSGTESDNLAIIGTVRKIISESKLLSGSNAPHVITTNIEHVAVLEVCRRLEKEGIEVTYLPVNGDGLVTAEQVVSALRPETVLVSVMLANNEIGTVLPVRQMGVALRKYKKERGRTVRDFPYLHTDASQAPNYLNVNADGLSVDLMTLDGSKIYGPKGVGCLVKKGYVPTESILYGGGQEDGLRPGTENVANIIGFAKALEISLAMCEKESARLEKLQKYFIDRLEKEFPHATLNGSRKNRLPNNINICIPDLNAEFAVIQLNQAGVCCAAMTACKNLSGDISSYVVNALGDNCGKSSLRFSMGRETKRGDIDFLIRKLKSLPKPHKTGTI